MALIFVTALGLTTPSAAQDAATPVPVDSAVIVGTLANGLRYYIRENRRPAGRAELRLVVNAGSVLEDEDQRGHAHLVEHMAFNGTRHFSGEALLDYLGRIGARIGPDVNAYTLWDQTVYQLGVPARDAELLAKGVFVLADMAHTVTFDSVALERQRQHVIEEWEQKQWTRPWGADLLRPLFYSGSRYAERMPAGTKESLESATRDQLRRFYRDWYQPDLMAVVAVGDFDAKVMVQLIRRHFGRIPRRKDVWPRPRYGLPLGDSARVTVAIDSQLVTPRVSVSWLRAPEPDGATTLDAVRARLLTQLYADMLKERLATQTHQAEPPFLAASASAGPVVPLSEAVYFAGMPRLSMSAHGSGRPAVQHFTLSVDVSDTGVARGLAAGLDEVARARRDGFEPAEWDRARRAALRGLEAAFRTRDQPESAYLVGGYINHFLYREPLASPTQIYALRKALLANLTLEDANRTGRVWLQAKDRLIVVTIPPRPGIAVPSKDSLLDSIRE